MNGGAIGGLAGLLGRAIAAFTPGAAPSAPEAVQPPPPPPPSPPRVIADVTAITLPPRPSGEAAGGPVAAAPSPPAAAGNPPHAPAGVSAPPPAVPAAPAPAITNAHEAARHGEPPAARTGRTVRILAAADDAAPAGGTAMWRETPPPPALATLSLPVRWYQRDGGDGGEAATTPQDRDRQTRFLAEIDGAAGRVQVDGLLTQRARSLSLIVRSEQPLDRQARQIIAGLFADGAALAGWDGELAFRDGAASLIDPGPPPAAAGYRLTA